MIGNVVSRFLFTTETVQNLEGKMNMDYTYRKHIFFIAKVLPYATGFYTIIFILSLIIQPVSFLSFMMGFLLVESIVMIRFYKRFTTMKLSINNEGIEFHNNKKDIFIKFDDIEYITIRVSKFGGFFSINSKNDGKVTVTVALKKIGKFVKILREKLLENNKDDIANDPKLFKFYKNSVYSDASFRRWMYLWPFGLIYLIGSFVLAITLSVCLDLLFIIPFLLSVFVFLIYFLILELLVYRKKIEKEIDPITWEYHSSDANKEKKAYNILIMVSISVFVLLSILVLII